MADPRCDLKDDMEAVGQESGRTSLKNGYLNDEKEKECMHKA